MLRLARQISLTLVVTQNSLIMTGKKLGPPDWHEWIRWWFDHKIPRAF